MGIIRNYFDKNNTIIKGSLVNTAKNPISELYCGGNVSRLLLYIDFTDLAEMATNKLFDPLSETTKHYLKLINTSNYDVNQTLTKNGDIDISGNFRSTSCDIEVRPITELWDEGIGYDYEPTYLLGDQSYNKTPSNWVNATNNTQFLHPGGINTPDILSTQHLDNGNENIILDVTSFVNQIITTGVTINTYTGTTNNYYGFCIKYSDESENSNTGNTRSLGLFTKYTDTFFEPYIETIYDDVITDDRNKFFKNKDNKLFLYVNIGGSLKNLDNLPTCTINETSYTVYQKTTGVYYVIVPASDTNTMTTYTEYNDIWTGLSYIGLSLSDVRLKFIPLDNTSYYNIGTNYVEPLKYGITVSGIKYGETLTSGEIKKINFLLRKPFTLNNYESIDELFYKLYIKQGNNCVEVFDWQRVNRLYETMSVYLDTSWLIPQTYYIDVKTSLGGEVNIYNEILRFTIGSKIKN